MPPREIQTDRLLLRVPCPDDAERIFARYAQDSEVTRFLPWRPHANVEETKAKVAEFIAAWEGGKSFPWVICALEDERLVGMIELRVQEHQADLGYVFARPEWGKGYASEAVRAVVDAGLAEPGVYRVWAICDLENPASARVLEKAGMSREGILRRFARHSTMKPEPFDVYCYAKVR